MVTTQALLLMGARTDSTDRSGATPLFTACEMGHVDCVRILLEAGGPVGRSNSAGEQPLYIAALRGHEACVEALLQHLLGHSLPWMVCLLTLSELHPGSEYVEFLVHVPAA